MAACGTISSYNNNHCRCQPCRDAYATWQREHRKRLRGEPLPSGVAHGSSSAISTYACRCAVCQEAKAAYDKARRERLSDRLREQRRERREKYGPRVRQQQRQHYARNRERVIARNTAYAQTEAGRRVKQAEWNRRRGVPFTAIGREFVGIVANDPCAYCGAPGPSTIDHIVPITSGGTGDWDNLTAACARCNASKRHEPLLQFLLRKNA